MSIKVDVIICIFFLNYDIYSDLFIQSQISAHFLPRLSKWWFNFNGQVSKTLLGADDRNVQG